MVQERHKKSEKTTLRENILETSTEDMQMPAFAQRGASGFFLMNSNARRKLKNSVFHSAQLRSVCAGRGGRCQGGRLQRAAGGGLGRGGRFPLSG